MGKTKKSQKRKELMRSMCSIKCSGQKDMEMHNCGGKAQKREGRAERASVDQQLASHYKSLVTAPSGPDSAVYGHEDRAPNHSKDRKMNDLKKTSGRSFRKTLTYNKSLRIRR